MENIRRGMSMIILKIAFRNLKEHKSKTLIVGGIIAVGIMVLVVGNSMMDTATAGIRRAYWDNYTGHIVISGKGKDKITLFGPQGANAMNSSVPKIPEYERIYRYVTSMPEVEFVNPQAYGMAIINPSQPTTSGGMDESKKSSGKSEESNSTGKSDTGTSSDSQKADELRTFTQLFGVDPVFYKKMFPNNMEIISGKFLEEGKSGILLSERIAKRLSEDGTQLLPGSKVLLTSMNDFSGMKIREVSVTGIFRFESDDPILSRVSIADIDTVRALNGMTVTSKEEVSLNSDEAILLKDVNDEELFGEGITVEESPSDGKKLDESTLLNILGDTSKRKELSKTDSGAWHFLLVKLKNPSDIKRVIKSLNEYFGENGIDAVAVDWVDAAGMTASLANNIKIIFNVVIFIIAVVAIIIIMNTIVISVTERIGEIGTMRAIGAQKSFVRRMIMAETTMISLVFGFIGVVLGGLVLWILNLKGIPAPNIFFEIIFGGKILHPVLSFASIIVSVVVVVVIGVVASLYPVTIALKIQPVQAMQRTA